MLDAKGHSARSKVIIYNDESTPWDFVTELLSDIFGMGELDANELTAAVNKQGQGPIGVYPKAVADAFVTAARDMIQESGHTLKIAAISLGAEGSAEGCEFCGVPCDGPPSRVGQRDLLVCDDCTLLLTAKASQAVDGKQFKFTNQALAWHFAGLGKDQIVAGSRKFPAHMRADVQVAVDRALPSETIRHFGINQPYRMDATSIAALLREGQNACVIAPAQYEDVDIGGDESVRCLDNSLWLCRKGDLRYAVVLSIYRDYGESPETRIEIAVPQGEAGNNFSREFFELIEKSVRESRSYRGKVLSLEENPHYQGQSRGVTVHRLAPVTREEVILPEKTLQLLDRNVLQFADNRDALRRLQQSTRKGILLYGPPGTGKTHTIRYLASNLAGHTTLIITAAQMGLLNHYMSLARLLQPALVVIEDVDLIARAREQMNGPCEESLLNSLLNHMDGLREDADIVFVLTTNRPEQLEVALAGRPGRIDQAIEVPLPDEQGRDRLIRLYGRGLQFDESFVQEAVLRTKGVSAAFIKELMRRAAQSCIGRNGGQSVTSADLGEALDDMLFTGGKLNVTLLGGAQEMRATP